MNDDQKPDVGRIVAAILDIATVLGLHLYEAYLIWNGRPMDAMFVLGVNALWCISMAMGLLIRRLDKR